MKRLFIVMVLAIAMVTTSLSIDVAVAGEYSKMKSSSSPLVPAAQPIQAQGSVMNVQSFKNLKSQSDNLKKRAKNKEKLVEKQVKAIRELLNKRLDSTLESIQTRKRVGLNSINAKSANRLNQLYLAADNDRKSGIKASKDKHDSTVSEAKEKKKNSLKQLKERAKIRLESMKKKKTSIAKRYKYRVRVATKKSKIKDLYTEAVISSLDVLASDYNDVYNSYFTNTEEARTTVEIETNNSIDELNSRTSSELKTRKTLRDSSYSSLKKMTNNPGKIKEGEKVSSAPKQTLPRSKRPDKPKVPSKPKLKKPKTGKTITGDLGSGACGTTAFNKPKKVVNHYGYAPLAIGDSTMLSAAPYLARYGYQVNARGCRPWSEGISIMKTLKSRGELPHLILFHLGANGGMSKSDVRQVISIAGENRVVAFMTPRKSGGGEHPDASKIRKAYSKNLKRVVLLDWAKYSKGHSSWFGDGLHPSLTGAKHNAKLGKKAIRWAEETSMPNRNKFG